VTASTPEFYWLFSAHFEDGTVIVQDKTDTVSTPEGIELNPKGSAFTDVRAALTRSRLLFFELHHTEREEHVTVDLVTGAFVINGTPFEVHDPAFEPTEHALEVVYHRTARVDIHQNDKGVEIGREHYFHRYNLGWTTEVDGDEKKATIAVGA
jgi:hypothetical protein